MFMSICVGAREEPPREEVDTIDEVHSNYFNFSLGVHDTCTLFVQAFAHDLTMVGTLNL